MNNISDDQLENIGEAIRFVELASGPTPLSDTDAKEAVAWMSRKGNVGLFIDVVEIDAAIKASGREIGVQSQARSRPNRVLLALAASVFGLSFILGSGWFITRPAAPQIYVTSSGETRSVALGEGSAMHVYGDSSLEVRRSAGEVEVRVATGGAMFKTQSGTPGKLAVRVKGGSIEPASEPYAYAGAESEQFEAGLMMVALRDEAPEVSDTEFNVLRRGDVTGIHVSQGEVRVLGEAQNEPVLLTEGESTELSVEGVVLPAKRVDESQLQFRSSTLGDMARIFNERNTVPQLKVLGRAQMQPLGGLVHIDNPAKLVLALRALGLYSIEPSGNTVVIRLKGDSSE